MNSNGLEQNSRPRIITCKLGSWREFQTSIQPKEWRELQFNMPNSCFHSAKEGSPSLTLQAIRTSSPTWSWAPVSLISLFWSYPQNQVSFSQVLLSKDRQESTLSLLNRLELLQSSWQWPKWAQSIGQRTGSIKSKAWLNPFWPIPAVIQNVNLFRSIQSVAWTSTDHSKIVGTRVRIFFEPWKK